jgi:hypothetical protein
MKLSWGLVTGNVPAPDRPERKIYFSRWVEEDYFYPLTAKLPLFIEYL